MIHLSFISPSLSLSPFNSEQTQEQGVTVIYDMTDAKYSNFGADLSMKLLNLLTPKQRILEFSESPIQATSDFAVTLIIRNDSYGLGMASCLLIEYPMSIEKAPFMATVGNCGGAIVSRNFILISGKCLCLGERPSYAYTGTSWGNIGNLPRESKLVPT
ncbi:unnamed protein product [Rodentolepis nana]|uniref:PNP_UDP_1 domain-containing protein n=1 Tax=Rodentolepis nana TaxID=102285 RepID=A0A0R3TBK9_RODNA|nr:unnamed protein product [Rodentolepis nana]